MCVTIWTQWRINGELPTTRPKSLLPAIPVVTGDTSQAVLAAAEAEAAAAGTPKDFVLAATAATPAARLFADVDPGGCGALTLKRRRHSSLQDSSEAGDMGRGRVLAPLRLKRVVVKAAAEEGEGVGDGGRSNSNNIRCVRLFPTLTV